MGSVADSVIAKVVLLFQPCKFFKEKQPKIGEKSVLGQKQAKSSVSKAVIGEFLQRLPPCLVDELKQYYRIDVPAPHPYRQVQVRSG